MSDVAAGASDRNSMGLPTLGELGSWLKRGDLALALALGMMTILVVLILPPPPLLLDFSLAISIIFSVLILMTALFMHAPLEFSDFPTVLLIATMLRLAQTRLDAAPVLVASGIRPFVRGLWSAFARRRAFCRRRKSIRMPA